MPMRHGVDDPVRTLAADPAHGRFVAAAVAAGLILAVALPAARADPAELSADLSLPRSAPAAPPADAAPGENAGPPAPDFAELGAEPAWWWSAAGVASLSFDGDATEFGARALAHTFVADGLEFHAGLAAWGHAQDGPDTGSLNPQIGFRWHFHRDRRLTAYAETGIGLLFSFDEVPDGGTRINFTPRAAVGTTIALGDGPERLDLGVGWHHISNASTSGTDDNPSRDSLFLYAGVIVPF